MKKHARLVSVVALAVVAFGAAGCFGRYLRWRAMPAAAALVGKVELVVVDHREPKRGGIDTRVIGNERNGWGIPFAIRLPTPTEAGESVRDLFGMAANSSGIGVAPIGDTAITSRVSVEIQNLWCDGYPPVYKASMIAAVSLLGPDNSVRMPAVPLAVEGVGWGCQAAYEKALSNGYQAAVALMSQEGFRAAAASGGTAVAPPPPAPVAPPAQ